MLFDMKFIHKGLTCLISVFVSSAAPSATLTSPIFPFVLIHSLTAVLREVKCFGNQSSFMHGFSIMRTLGILSEAKKKREVKIPVLCANYPSAFGCEMKEVEMKRIECMFGIVFNVWTWIYLRKKLHVKLRIITFSSVIKAGNECAEEGGNEDPNLHKVIY